MKDQNPSKDQGPPFLVKTLRAVRLALPSRFGWLSLLCGVSGYPLLLSLIAVVLAKYSVMNRLQAVDTGLFTWLSLIASDVAVHFVLIAIFALGESRRPRLSVATLPLAILVSALAFVNALYLQISGEQLSWEAFTIGVERSSEVLGILAVDDLVSLGRIAVFLLAIAVPAIAMYTLARVAKFDKLARLEGRGRAAAWVAGIALVGSFLASNSEFIPLRALQGNASLATYTDWAFGGDSQSMPTSGQAFAGYAPVELASAEQVQAFAKSGKAVNLLVVVLESVRWDYTSLYGATHAKTPTLEALAAQGTLVDKARSVMPHTSKSLFSMLCGRLPMMQRPNYEALSTWPVQCLPALLGQAGYKTVFMQTALGSFEDRPRLVQRLGFREFLAWENTQGEPAGYLASDDQSLEKEFANWLETKEEGTPFFATLLTSATHHPYVLVGDAKVRALASGASRATAQERYARLVEAQDAMLAGVIASLKAKGLWESTIVVITGDHGEGFGDKGVRQHDNNFYEEGLRVPLVIAGPGVPHRRITKNVSLIDLPLTLLEILGIVPVAPLESYLPVASIYDERNRNLPRPFACYFGGYCYGYVQADQKVLVAKGIGRTVYFDLASDPKELRAKVADTEMQSKMQEVFRVMESHHSERRLEAFALDPQMGAWNCQEGNGCRHPNSPKTKFFPRK